MRSTCSRSKFCPKLHVFTHEHVVSQPWHGSMQDTDMTSEVAADPDGVLKIGEKLKLVPGHCDPTCNIHDWYVGVRNGKVEALWPITARGKAF